jgi:hypothetical protein
LTGRAGGDEEEVTDAGRFETLLYDAENRRTDDRTKAVRSEVVELDERGRVVRRLPELGWHVDERALAGDAGEAATRPDQEGK